MKNRIMVSAVEAGEVLGTSERQIHILRKRVDFPRPVRFSPRCVRWFLDELEAWAKSQPRHEVVEEPAQLSRAHEAS